MSESEEIEPRANSDLVGQEAAESQFLDAWNAGRLPHAWLLAGPRGIGKATLAYRIARFVLAEGAQEAGGGLFGGAPAALGIGADHPIFRKVASGGHPDLRVLERGWDEDRRRRQSDIPVDAVRALGEFFDLTPALGGWRVAVIDAADELNRSGANGLLKLLEEPPNKSLILLVAHSPDRLLPTIRSRCRRLNLRPLLEETVIALLRKRRPGLAEPDARAIARLCDGSPGAALALEASGGLDLYREMIGLIGRMPALDPAAAQEFADRVGGAEEPTRTVAALLLRWLAAATTGTGSEAVAGERDLGRRMVEGAGPARWLELWDRVRQRLDRMEAVNLDRKAVLLDALLGLAKLARV